MAANAIQLKRNDLTPEFVNDKPTDRQIAAERFVLFTHILKNLGVPRQVNRFIWTIYTLTKPGEQYHFNDYQIAEYLGCDGETVSRNYVSSVRKKMRDWNNSGYDDHGTKHYSFVSVIENNYDPKTKKQNPTGYVFSKEFADKLDQIHDRVRNHIRYNDNWLQAVKSVCGEVGRSEFSEFGFWNFRKEKRERSMEDIIGTLLLNWKRSTRRLVTAAMEFGFDKEDISAWLRATAPGYIQQAVNNELFFGPTLTIKVPGGDIDKDFTDGNGNKVIVSRFQLDRKVFMEVFGRAFKYVVQKEYGEIKDAAEIAAEREKRNARNSTRRSAFVHKGRAESDDTGTSSVGQSTELRPWAIVQPLQNEFVDQLVDIQRQRFLENVTAVGGPRSGVRSS